MLTMRQIKAASPCVTRCAKRAFAAVLALALVNLCGCIEWNTNAQGKLQSIGVPGVPVWESQTLKDQEKLSAQGALAASPGTMLDPKAADLTAAATGSEWLGYVNHWRAGAGVDPVGENYGLDSAAGAHARYLVENGPRDPHEFRLYSLNLGSEAHNETRGNQYFTDAGFEAARMGDVSWESAAHADIDGLVEVPFHRLSILAPWMRAAGYAYDGRYPRRAAVLVMRGSVPAGLAKTIYFPPQGSSVAPAMTQPEFPDPLAACPGYRYPVGTPITVQLGALVRVTMESNSLVDESSGRQLETCGFDSRSYPLEWGRRVLVSYGAVVVVPREPLTPGHNYRVSIRTRQYSFAWNFSASSAASGLHSASVGSPPARPGNAF